jgi:uncharacterized YigZ family protein
VEDLFFNSVRGVSEGLYKEKGSKFIGIVAPCRSEEEAKELLNEWKKAHHQARHLCYAYRFGYEMKVYRANDDGEPSNSAGAPILGQIQSFELTNVLVGVVRYYGGTKLGVGGLINAYRTAAKEALQEAEIITLPVLETIHLKFGYDQMPEVMHLVKSNDLQTVNNDFGLKCELKLEVPILKVDILKQAFSEIKQVQVVEETDQ